MAPKKDLVKVQNTSVLDTYTEEERQVIRDQICKDGTDAEIKMFLLICRDVGLNPFTRQIYGIKRGGKMTIQTSIDGFRAIAAGTGKHAGTDDAVYDDEKGAHPNKATVTVWKMVDGQRVPFTATARWEEYKQEFEEWVWSQQAGKKVKSGKRVLGEHWEKMPYLMLAKCAESLALRKAFPQQLSGIYTQDEMAQADHGEAPVMEKPQTTIKAQVVEEKPQAKASDEQLNEIDYLIKENGWEWPVVNKWAKDTFGHEIESLGAVHATVMISSLKERASRQPAQAPAQQNQQS